jgi:hypothetical protein
LNTFSSSINTTIKSKLDSESIISGSVQIIITGTTGYSTFSSSVSTSIGAFSSSVATTTSGLSSSIGSLSSSIATTTSELSSSIGSLSSSVATTTLGIKNRVDSIEAKTGSYATTGSNIFQGNQTITGSLYITQDLIVAGSSSIQNISSSILNIGDNIITVNALNPSVRFGGLAVIDSGSSPQVSGSMLFDSVNDQWIFIHQNQSSVTSSILLMGPQTFNNVGNEAFPTNNRLLKSVNAEHLGDSNVSDDGTTVTILSNAIVNGTFSSTGTTLVSGSSQITHDSTTGYVANRHIDHTAVSISAGNGLSGGGDISTTRTLTLDTGSVHFLDGVKKELNTEGVISGSSQILAGTTIHSGSFFNGISVVSGSAQVSFNGITDKPTLVSGSSQVSFNGITDKPTLVSGSSQITYGSISSIPSGIVSGSGQIDLTATTNYASGILTRLNAVGVFSGSSQIDLTATTNYSTGIKTRLNAEGVVSGSAQISLTSTQVTNGLGYTPYNSTNPSGYITGINSSAVTTALGYTPYNSTNPSGYITGISFANVSSKPTTLSGYGITDALNNAVTSEQTIGFRYAQINNSDKTIKFDPRWNESTYDADLGTLHIYSTTAAGANYGRAGIALYNGSAYQYLTTKASTTGLFANNSLIATAGSTPSFAGLSSNGTITITSGTPTGAASNNANSYLRIDSAANQYIELRTNASATGAMQGMLFTDNGVNGFIGFKEYTGGANYGEAIHISVTDYSSSDAGSGIYLGASSNNANGVTTPWFSIRGGTSYFYGNVLPDTNNSRNLGSASFGWANVYTNDLHLSNMNKPEGNDVDGTNGNWTIQEGAEQLYIINNNNGKKYKIDLTEII